MKKWTLTVEGEGDDLYLTFPEDLLEEMQWGEGDVLNWNISDDGTVTLTKKVTDAEN